MSAVRHSPAPASAKSILRYLLGTGSALWLLVMALQPDVGFAAPLPWLGLFWLLKISTGLAVLQSVLYLLSRSQYWQTLPLWLLVAASGVAGAALLTPLYWLIGEGLMQTTLGFAEIPDGDGSTHDEFGSGLAGLLQEFGELAGPVTASWMLISWPRLQGLLPPLLAAPQVSAIDTPTLELHTQSTADVPARAAWRAALPAALGDDLIAVGSELQYLRVWTTRGTALVLGALQEVEDSEGVSGMRVHRSWWVHANHVRSVRRRSDALVCRMSDGRDIPVSRRRKADVLARFGDTAVYATPAGADSGLSNTP
jgi:hypothetical protein